MKKKEHISQLLTNIIILIMIVALYLLTNSPQNIAATSTFIKYRGNSSRNAVALQFAVYWNASALYETLQVLDESGVKATFFVSGEWAARNPDTLKSIYERGHEIGTLGMYADSINEDIALNDLIWGLEQSIKNIKEACGTEPRLYYCGSMPALKASKAAKALDLECIQCTIDLLCSRGSASDIVERSKTANAGSIVHLTPTKEALAALPDIIQLFRGSSLNILSTGELIND